MADSKTRRRTAKVLTRSLFSMFKDINHSNKMSLKESVDNHSQLREPEEQRRTLPVETPPVAAMKNPTSSGLYSTEESEEDKSPSSTEPRPSVMPSTCPVKHEGKMVLKESYPMSVDTLFNLVFTHNKFNTDLMETLKYTDVNVSSWEENSSTGLKTRSSTLVVPVTQPIGPKTCHVRETQVLQACSKPGELYVIEMEANNSGVPYADSFYITNHFCITSDVTGDAIFTVYSQIKYRKSVWGIVKNFIEKNVWVGLDEYFQGLTKALELECSRKVSEVNTSEAPRKQKRESIKVSTSVPQAELVVPGVTPSSTPLSLGHFNLNNIALWAMLGVVVTVLFFNIVLYYKLSSLQDVARDYRIMSTIDSRLLKEQRTPEQWLSLLQKQALQHQEEIQAWKLKLQSVMSLLNQINERLQPGVLSEASERVSTALNSLLEPDHSAITKVLQTEL